MKGKNQSFFFLIANAAAPARTRNAVGTAALATPVLGLSAFDEAVVLLFDVDADVVEFDFDDVEPDDFEPKAVVDAGSDAGSASGFISKL